MVDRPIRVLLADDHELVREGLASLLATDPDVTVVGEAATGAEAVELTRRLAPDLVLLDIRMPDLDGLQAIEAIKRDCPQTAVLMVTMYEDPSYLVKAIAAGATGYVLKGIRRAELLQMIRTVADGGSAIDPALMSSVLRGMTTGPDVAEDPTTRLTSRELQVLRLIVDGLTNKEIAGRLCVSTDTVKRHVEHIIKKLQVSDRTQAAVQAVRRGLIRE